MSQSINYSQQIAKVMVAMAAVGLVAYVVCFNQPPLDDSSENHGRVPLEQAAPEEGKGVMTSPDGQKYEGDWVDGKREGKGVMTSPDGQKYEGDWVAGKQ